MSDLTFEVVKPLISQMPESEVQRLRDWLNQPVSEIPEVPSDLTWGARLVALFDEFELGEADQMDIPDPETWVRDYRANATRKRPGDWDSE